ncbi:MAG: hypothetical protein GYA15_09475 [Leptolinea sp.]|jgi:hypothetical protein|nr:hypothetical protein [Leptolinea sp.]
MVDRQDRRWIVITSVILLGITSIPYLLGYFRQGSDWHFTGFIFGVEDGNSYIAKMLSGSYGSWLFRSPYSNLPQNGVLAFLPYILLGKLAYPPEIHDQLVALFQVFRWLAGGFLVRALFLFCGLFLKEKRYQRLAVLIILTGGGFGWLGWLLPGHLSGRMPLEIYSPEAFGFLSLLGLPHLAAARAFLLLGLVFFLRTPEPSKELRNAAAGGLCWLAAGFFQPLSIVVGYGILGVYFLLRLLIDRSNNRRDLLSAMKRMAVMAAVSSPWVIYNLFFFASDDYLKAWYAQNIISSPPLIDYLWSYGLFLAASIPAIIHILRKKDERSLILPAWIICAAALAYFPYNVQRRFIDGIWIALILLVFVSLEAIKKSTWVAAYKVLLGSTLIAPLLVLSIFSQGVWNLGTPVYRPAGEVVMFTTISELIQPGDVILADYSTGNALPAWDAVFVLAGHGPESANLKLVLPEIRAFYSGDKDPEWQKNFIERNRIDFIVCGPAERALGDWEKKFGDMYKTVYDRGVYRLYSAELIDGN